MWALSQLSDMVQGATQTVVNSLPGQSPKQILRLDMEGVETGFYMGESIERVQMMLDRYWLNLNIELSCPERDISSTVDNGSGFNIEPYITDENEETWRVRWWGAGEAEPLRDVRIYHTAVKDVLNAFASNKSPFNEARYIQASRYEVDNIPYPFATGRIEEPQIEGDQLTQEGFSK